MKIDLFRYPVRTLSIMLILIVFMIFLNSGAILGQSYNTTYAKVTVEKGDTLWSIADRFSNDSNLNSVMLSIIKYNQLPNHNLEAGQILYVPLNNK